MAPTPRRIAQTSTEAKKQYKKGGSLHIPDRQQKQLERAVELDERAARLREAEDRRRIAKKKREEKEKKEALARKQMGVGLATQLIGYSHTQAQLKNGMEAFLGLKKRKKEEKRMKELELTKTLEDIEKDIEKEPWDEDEVKETGPKLPDANISFGAQWVDDDLDDDSLLEAHNSVLSDTIGQPAANKQPPARIDFLVPPASSTPASSVRHIDFVRLHGPVNKAVEATLNKLPEPLIELLSEDLSLKVPDWDPPLALLHKLNPLGIPPHRLRLKVGCVVTLLKDLNSSSQLPKSQHLRIIRVDRDRLECLVLDGQMEGTKTFLKRIAFPAKYKNQDEHPFERTQFPIRVSTDYTPSVVARDTSQFGFKLPTIPADQGRSTSLRRASESVNTDSTSDRKPAFKLPAPAKSKSGSSTLFKSIVAASHKLPSVPSITDGWDDFLDSSTQIARELAMETPVSIGKPSLNPVTALPPKVDSFPFLSTQDLDFSLDDLDDDAAPQGLPADSGTTAKLPEDQGGSAEIANPTARMRLKVDESTNPRVGQLSNAGRSRTKIAITTKTPHKVMDNSITREILALPPHQRPASVSDRPGLKRKAWRPPQGVTMPQPKKASVPFSRQSLPAKQENTATPLVKSPIKAQKTIDEVLISSQDAALFFDDDDSLSFGSPPIQA